MPRDAWHRSYGLPIRSSMKPLSVTLATSAIVGTSLYFGTVHNFFVVANFFGGKRVEKHFEFIVLSEKGSLFEWNTVQCRSGLHLETALL